MVKALILCKVEMLIIIDYSKSTSANKFHKIINKIIENDKQNYFTRKVLHK